MVEIEFTIHETVTYRGTIGVDIDDMREQLIEGAGWDPEDLVGPTEVLNAYEDSFGIQESSIDGSIPEHVEDNQQVMDQTWEHFEVVN